MRLKVAAQFGLEAVDGQTRTLRFALVLRTTAPIGFAIEAPIWLRVRMITPIVGGIAWMPSGWVQLFFIMQRYGAADLGTIPVHEPSASGFFK
jgi:hypothetical protein